MHDSNDMTRATDSADIARQPVVDPDPRRRVRLRVAGAAAAVLALGGVVGGTAWANAASPTTQTVAGAVAGGDVESSSGDSTTGPAAPGTDGPAAPSAPAAPGSQDGTDRSDAPQPPKPQPHIDGTVTGTSGSTITVKDPEGFTRVVKVSSSTKYSDGLSASLAGGTEIHAVGTVASDGTSLDATEVGKRPTPPAPPAGGPGRGPGEGRGPAAPPAPGEKGTQKGTEKGAAPKPGSDTKGTDKSGTTTGEAPQNGPAEDGKGNELPSDAPQPPTGTDAPQPPATTEAPSTTG